MTARLHTDQTARIIIAVLVLVHTAACLFGCIDVCFRYTVSVDGLPAGTVTVEKTVGSCALLNLTVGAATLVFLYLDRKPLYRLGFWLRLAAFALSCAEPFLVNTLYPYPMGGLGRYIWEFTLQGYLTLALAGALVLLQGWLSLQKEAASYDL